MKERHEGGSLPARRNIGHPKLIDNINPQRRGHKLPISQLHGHPVLGVMPNGLTMKSDQVDCAIMRAGSDRIDMGLRDPLRERIEIGICSPID